MWSAGVNGAYLENQEKKEWFDQGHTCRACAYIWKWFGEASESNRSGNVLPYNSERNLAGDETASTCHMQKSMSAHDRSERDHFISMQETKYGFLCGCHHRGIGQASQMQHSNETSLSKRNIFNRKNERMMSGMDPTPNCKGFSEPRYKQNPSDFWLTRLSYLGKEIRLPTSTLNEKAKR